MTSTKHTRDVRPVVTDGKYESVQSLISLSTLDPDHEYQGYIQSISFTVSDTENQCTVTIEGVISRERPRRTYTPKLYIRTNMSIEEMDDHTFLPGLTDAFPTIGREHTDVDDAHRELHKLLYEISRNLHSIVEQ